MLLCCHPDLPAASQIALTLRAVAGLTTAQIAQALLSSEQAIAQRIVRAKARLRDVSFGMPPAPERGARLAAVLQVLYLLFTEGHVASMGPHLRRDDLAAGASRVSDDGELVPLAEQDRSRWDGATIAEGVTLVEETLARCPLGPYQLQAAIAAVHTEAPDADATDWTQILALFDLLRRFGDNPVVALNVGVGRGAGCPRRPGRLGRTGGRSANRRRTASTPSAATSWRRRRRRRRRRSEGVRDGGPAGAVARGASVPRQAGRRDGRR